MLLAFTLACSTLVLTASSSNDSASLDEVRLLVLAHTYEAAFLRPMELGARWLEQELAGKAGSAGNATSRKVRVRIALIEERLGAAAQQVADLIDTFEPCAITGALSPNPEITLVAAFVAMHRNVMFVPVNDVISRTVVDGMTYNLTLNLIGSTLGGATFLKPFMHFMDHFGWRRAVVLLDEHASVLVRELYDQTKGMDIAFLFVSLRVDNYLLDIERVLDYIEDGHYSIIGVSLTASSDDRYVALFDMAAQRGLTGVGYQWCAMMPSYFVIRDLPRELFHFGPSGYEFRESDPGAWQSGIFEKVADGFTTALAQMKEMETPERLLCDTEEACVGNFNMPDLLQEGNLDSLKSYAFVYLMGAISASLMDAKLCGSAAYRLQASHQQVKEVASVARQIPSMGLAMFDTVPGGLSRAMTTTVHIGETYSAHPGIPRYDTLSTFGAHRIVAAIGRQGEVRLKDLMLNIPASSFSEVFGRPFTFMGNTTSVPLDYVPDSCGRKAWVNGTSCIPCEYGSALPMNGTNRCLPAAEECKLGYMWSAEDVSCAPCGAGRFGIDGACQACPLGRTSSSGQYTCERCIHGYYQPAGTDDCLFCHGDSTTFMPYRSTKDACELDINVPVCAFGLVALTTAIAQLLSQIHFTLKGPWIRGRPVWIEDISTTRGQAVVTCLGVHSLMRRWGSSLVLSFQHTGHFQLDDPGARFLGKVLSADRICITSRKGGSTMDVSLDSAQGCFHLTPLQTLVHTGSRLPITVCAAFCVTVSLAAGAVVSPFERVWVNGLGVVLGILFSTLWKMVRRTSSLDKLLKNYRQDHCGEPVPVPRGPGRAMRAGHISEFSSHFQGVIKNRNMHFVASNIVMPVTRQHGLSLAEVIAPQRVQYFCSHWWGEEFSYTVASIVEHAMHPSVCGGAAWQDVAYWICTFANNQHKVTEDLGRDCFDSSFYLTLRSGFCLGTCLILRESVEPLRRSWCLFEFIQTMDLTGSSGFANFKGLFFCTRTGVLNFGKASVELSLQIGATSAELRLEDAQATFQKDKLMIDHCVESTMGGFEATNARLRAHIATAVHAAKAFSDAEFAKLFVSLERERHQAGDAVNGTTSSL